MTFSLSTPITRNTSISVFELISTTDNPSAKTVVSIVSIENVGINTFLLWSDKTYDSIGQWTDDDVISAVKKAISDKYNTQ